MYTANLTSPSRNSHRHPEPLAKCYELRIDLAVKIRCRGRKGDRECLRQVCLICEVFTTKVVVQGMEKMVLCWRRFPEVRWMVQYLPAKSQYGTRGHLHQMRPVIVMEER